MNETLTKQEIKRLRDSEMFKFDNVSDFKSIRRCYRVAKELCNCLRYFDSRASRFSAVFDSEYQQKYQSARAYHIPDEYFNFQFLSVKIAIYRDRRYGSYFVGVHGFIPKTFKSENVDSYNKDFLADLPTNFSRYGSSKIFSEVKDSYMKIVFEFLDKVYRNGYQYELR